MDPPVEVIVVVLVPEFIPANVISLTAFIFMALLFEFMVVAAANVMLDGEVVWPILMAPAVVILPLKMATPDVSTVRDSRAAPLPMAFRVTAPEPAVIARDILFGGSPNKMPPKLTAPLPVLVFMMMSSNITMFPVALLRSTPADVPVVIEPLRNVEPDVVIVNDFKAVVVPIARNITTIAEPLFMVRD